MNRYVPLFGLLTVTALAGGGSSPSSSVPRFEKTPCVSLPPELRDRRVTCGYVRVPLRHEHPGGERLTIEVTVVHPRSGPALPDPIVFLHGGPGGSSEGVLSLLDTPPFRELTGQRDLVLFDQRGGGRSALNLTCSSDVSSIQRLDRALLPVSRQVEGLRREAQFCRGQLQANAADFGAVTSVQSAADVDAIRRALGATRVNLYGLSYGTHLAQEVVRHFPHSVRSVVLDSPLPSGEHATRSTAFLLDRVMTAVASECGADPVCRTQYPDARTLFPALVAQLRAQPPTVTLGNLRLGRRTVRVPTATVWRTLFLTLTGPPQEVLGRVKSALDGNFAWLAESLPELFGSPYGGPDFGPVEYAVGCAGGFLPHGEGGAGLAVPALALDLDPFDDLNAEVCRMYAGPSTPHPAEPVRSNVPALILAGNLDPITPPSYGERVRSLFARSQLVVFPHGGHGQSMPGDTQSCAARLIRAFLNQPSGAVDGACARARQRVSVHRRMVLLTPAEVAQQSPRWTGSYLKLKGVLSSL